MEVIGNSGSGVNLCIRMTLNVKGDADCRKVDQGEDCQYLESATAREGVEREERAAGARARRRRGATILEYFHLGDGRQTPLCSLFEATTSANWSSLLVGKQNALPGAWGPSRGQTANLNGSIAQQHGKCAGVQLQELPSHIQAYSARICATDADFGANFHDLPAFVRRHS